MALPVLECSAFLALIAVASAAYVACTLARHADAYYSRLSYRINDIDRLTDMRQSQARAEEQIEKREKALKARLDDLENEVTIKLSAAVEKFVGVYQDRLDSSNLEEVKRDPNVIVNEDWDEVQYREWKYNNKENP